MESKWLNWDLEEFPYYTMGVSHICYERETEKDFELMFYDFDGDITETDIETILEAFPNDCLLFETNRGFHFVSLCISFDWRKTTKKAYRLSKKLSGQDYNLKKYNYLSLRVLPKYHFWGEIYCKAPKFVKVLKRPSEHSICSLNHLRIYEKMDMSKKAISLYESCYLKNFEIKLKVYMCRH